VRIIITDTTIHGPLIGGAQTFLPLLIRGLCDNGHKVHLVCLAQPDARMKAAIETAGCELHICPWKKNELVEDVAPRLAKWINDLSPDVYVVSVSPDLGWVVLPLLNSTIAKISIGHTDSTTFYAPLQHYQKYITQAVGVSQQVCEQYASKCGLQQEKISWIPYGVQAADTMPANLHQEKLELIYVGRLEEEQKRVSDLIKIAEALAIEKINYHFTVVGDGPERMAFEAAIANKGLDNFITLKGWLSSSEVRNYLHKAHIFLLTSAYEGFCIALVEAMANGCCPVVTKIESGNDQLINNETNGYLLPIGDISAFTTTIKQLSHSKELLLQLRQKAWQAGTAYSIPSMVGKYEHCFERAVLLSKTNKQPTDPTFPLMESCRSTFPKWVRRIKKSFVK
jgi:glycosyltransferase involved in cell wall biosynthesis